MSFNVNGEQRRYRTRVTIDAGNIDSNLTGFTSIFQVADISSEFVDLLNATGGDIIVTNNAGIRVPISVEKFNQGTYTGVIAALTTLASSGDTEYHIYGGHVTATQPLASATYGSENATNNNVKMRLTLDEDPSGVGFVMLDTTGNANHGDPYNMESGDSISAKANNGIALDGVNEFINITNSADIDFDTDEDFSISITFRIPTGNQPAAGGTAALLGKWDSFTTPYSYSIRIFTQNFGTPADRFKIVFGRYDEITNPTVVSANTYNDGIWHHLIAWKTGNTMYLKIDDASIVSTTDTTTGTTLNTSDITIGKEIITSNELLGDLDEILIYNNGVGKAWAKARAFNILTPNTFYTFSDRIETFNKIISII